MIEFSVNWPKRKEVIYRSKLDKKHITSIQIILPLRPAKRKGGKQILNRF